MEREIVRLDMNRDFEAFEELSVISFGEGTNSKRKMYEWLFDKNPYNKSGNMMYLLKEGGKVIGCDGLLPNELYVNGKTVLAAHSVKSMTHPDYKKQGIFRMMTQNSCERGKQDGVDVVIGLANDQSYPAYQKFGWPTLFEKEVYVKPILINNILKRRIKIGFLSSVGNSIYTAYMKNKLKVQMDKEISFEILNTVPKNIQKCWDTYKSKYNVLLVRDYKYLNYRYNERPDVKYITILAKIKNEIIGFAILHNSVANGSKMTSCVEFFTDPTNARYIKSLANVISKYCYDNGIEYVVVGTGLHGKFKNVLLSNGFMITRKPPKNNMMIANILSDKLTMNEINGHEKWHITQGDGETELDL
ncbi:GNAT family N-acetyltransferase [Sedimentibacter sp. MB31-C6]|uniref:GNAT family N-acetyltransferase n=1 Tax=Sedimentibacter sp. MB31-C6 TaxID=3109366 RepID=UPI002DDD5892|nr:GNAT family N-acetyltransferase [Sedimentibacter sp. MB36-C1]WSI03925.1 GNAT family N-acetyltransferase [Sedimentibacter sp. MB36-C1]